MYQKLIKYFSNLKPLLKSRMLQVGCLVVFFFLFTVIFLLKSIVSIDFIKEYFYKNTGLKIEFVNPVVSFNYKFDLNFKADKISLFNANKSTKFVEIDKFDSSIKPMCLIFKKLNIKKLSIDKIQADIYQDKTGKIELFEILKNKDFKFINKNLTLTRVNSFVKNTELNYKNDYQIQSEVNFNFVDTKLNLSKKKKRFEFIQNGTVVTTINSLSDKSLISAHITSRYPFNSLKSKDLNLDISFDNFNLYVLSDLAKKYISKDIVKLSGVLNLQAQTNQENQILNSALKDLKLQIKDKGEIIPYGEDILSNLIFKLDKNTLTIEDLNILSKDININAKGAVDKIFSKNPDINLETKISKTQINNFLYFLPDNLIYYNLKGIPTLKKANFYALLDGTLKIKMLPLNIQGTLKASDIHIPNYPKPYIQNDVNFYFMKDKVRTVARIYTPQNEYVSIDGVSNLDDSLWGKYSVSSTQNIDLAYAQLYLVPIQQIIGFNIGPVPIMDISGFGNIDIKTQGTIKDAQIFGKFSARNATAKIHGLNAQLKNGSCELVFDNRNLIFKNFKGKIDKADFLLSGTGNTKGEIDLNIRIKNILASRALEIIKNSIPTKKYSAIFSDISAVSGMTDAEINFKGIIDDYENVNFLNNLDLSGKLNLKNNKIALKNSLKANSVKGEINFGNSQDANLDFNINNSKFSTSINIKQNLEKIIKGDKFPFELALVSPKIYSKDIIDELISLKTLNNDIKNILKFANEFEFCSKLSLNSKGETSIKNFNLSNVLNKGYLAFLNNSNNKNLYFKSGIVKFEGAKMIFDNLVIKENEGSIKLQGDIDKFLSFNPIFNVEFDIEHLKLDEFISYFSKIKPQDCILKNGKIAIKNNNLRLNNINIENHSLPLFINAQVKDIFKSKIANADFSTILNESTTDSVINPFLTTPLKIKGEVPIKGNFKGKTDSYLIDFIAKIPKNSDISFSGANIGDINYDREISARASIDKNIANIQNLRLVKLIQNQNNKTNPLTLLKVSGQLRQNNNDLFYKNFKISTLSNMNVRTLNMIFKKSLLKQGNFECAINLEGNVKTPKVTGTVKLEDLDIPLYDTKINNIDIDINDKYINATAIAKNKESDVNLHFKALNNLKAPYIVEKVDIESNKLNVAQLLNSIEPQSAKTDISPKADVLIKPSDLIIKSGTFVVNSVNYNKINAQNIKALFDFKDNIFNLNNLTFDIAQGNIKGSGKYYLNKNALKLDAKMHNCDSNILSEEFLNLSGQIFGNIDGSINLSAKGLNTPDNIKNIKSNVEFVVLNGKMPKLGSLEYLLRAGNLIKNGILGFSLNNLIQVLTPYKTGEFEEISGKLTLANGEVKNLEIISKGKNLSMFLEGSYDILKNFADIKIYGSLSQSVTNVLGAAGNASIKQIIDALSPNKNSSQKDSEIASKLNKIPSVEGNLDNPKYFRAKVLGDINKDNYIKSFNWL